MNTSLDEEMSQKFLEVLLMGLMYLKLFSQFFLILLFHFKIQVHFVIPVFPSQFFRNFFRIFVEYQQILLSVSLFSLNFFPIDLKKFWVPLGFPSDFPSILKFKFSIFSNYFEIFSEFLLTYQKISLVSPHFRQFRTPTLNIFEFSLKFLFHFPQISADLRFSNFISKFSYTGSPMKHNVKSPCEPSYSRSHFDNILKTDAGEVTRLNRT